jgi:hypothetical protein
LNHEFIIKKWNLFYRELFRDFKITIIKFWNDKRSIGKFKWCDEVLNWCKESNEWFQKLIILFLMVEIVEYHSVDLLERFYQDAHPFYCPTFEQFYQDWLKIIFILPLVKTGY